MGKNRSRKNKFTLYFSEDEDRILDAKYKMSNMRSKSNFLRHMTVYVERADCHAEKVAGHGAVKAT